MLSGDWITIATQLLFFLEFLETGQLYKLWVLFSVCTFYGGWHQQVLHDRRLPGGPLAHVPALLC